MFSTSNRFGILTQGGREIKKSSCYVRKVIFAKETKPPQKKAAEKSISPQKSEI